MSTTVVKPVKSVKSVTLAECVGCHETKRIQARGMCPKCYMKQRRRGVTAIDVITNLADKMEHRAQEQIDFAQQARKTLLEGLPEAAMLMRRAAVKAAEKGDHRPAEAILTGLPIDDKNPSRRVLEPATTKAPVTAPVAMVLQIGFAAGLGGQREPAQLPAAVVIDAQPALE
jgi:hypothetical protein